MTSEQKERLLEDTIIESIQTMKEASPPEGFSSRVMAELEPKRPSLWSRLRLWLVRPQTIALRPLQVIPVATCVIALLALTFIKMDTPVSDDGIRLSTVRFVLNDSNMNARNVSVIGSFNDWKAERSIMWYDDETKSWVLEAQLPPGDHEYLFLVNGEKLVPDPQAQMTRDDGFGNKNSIMFVNEKNEQVL